VQVEGGFVQVPFNAALNPSAFSLEAWVVPFDEGFHPDPQYYQCLVESTGPAGLGKRTSGWGLFIGPQDPGVAPFSPLRRDRMRPPYSAAPPSDRAPDAAWVQPVEFPV